MGNRIDKTVQTINNLKATLSKEKIEGAVVIPKEDIVPTLLSLLEEMHYRLSRMERDIGPGDSFIDPRDEIHPTKVTSI
jgi:hypothetical protein